MRFKGVSYWKLQYKNNWFPLEDKWVGSRIQQALFVVVVGSARGLRTLLSLTRGRKNLLWT